MSLLRLSHVCLATPDLERLLRFYADELGCRVVHTFLRPDGQRYGVFLLVGGGTFLEVFTGEAEPRPDAAIRHFCFQVADIETLAARLRSAGQDVTVRRGRTDRVLLAEAKDPDGRTVEFHQYDSHSVQFPYLPTPAEPS